MEALKKIPAALVAALAVQAIAGLMWAGAAVVRISALESKTAEQGQMTERLARLEEQSLAMRARINRIEWQSQDRH